MARRVRLASEARPASRTRDARQAARHVNQSTTGRVRRQRAPRLAERPSGQDRPKSARTCSCVAPPTLMQQPCCSGRARTVVACCAQQGPARLLLLAPYRRGCGRLALGALSHTSSRALRRGESAHRRRDPQADPGLCVGDLRAVEPHAVRRGAGGVPRHGRVIPAQGSLEDRSRCAVTRSERRDARSGRVCWVVQSVRDV
jgi:hypothetical protein